MQSNGFLYEKTSEGITITGYCPKEEETELVIPAQLCGLPVVSIGAEAFLENGASLVKVEVPSSVTHIGAGAFKMCMSLMELVLHEGLEEIGAEALTLTPLEEVRLPLSLRCIHQAWELGSIRWTIDENHPFFFTDDICLYQKSGGEQILLVARQQEEPWCYEVAPGTTVVGNSAFAGNESLTEVVLPASVREIGAMAFEGCQNLKQIVIGDAAITLREREDTSTATLRESGDYPTVGLQKIGDNAFSRCIRLRRIHLPATVCRIGRLALSDTFGWSDSLLGLEEITVDADNPYFYVEDDTLFAREANGRWELIKYFGQKREYRVPDGVTHILPSAFRRTVLRRCILPKSVKDVGQDAFRECQLLEEFVLEETNTQLYVPQQPVYRKDEVSDLLFSSERVQQLRKERAMIELPEKWKSFAKTMVSSKIRSAHVDLDGAYVYDYRGYDQLFQTYLNMSDLCSMACCRLLYPVRLTEETRQRYLSFLEEHFVEIIETIVKTQNMKQLAMLADLRIFTEDNMEQSLEIITGAGQTQMTSFLLDYKRMYIKETAFDFSL